MENRLSVICPRCSAKGNGPDRTRSRRTRRCACASVTSRDENSIHRNIRTGSDTGKVSLLADRVWIQLKRSDEQRRMKQCIDVYTYYDVDRNEDGALMDGDRKILLIDRQMMNQHRLKMD